MRVATCLAIGCSALLALGAVGRPNEGRPSAPMAFQAIRSLRRGDVLTYRLRLPKGELMGAPGEFTRAMEARPPRRPEDYESRFLRVVVVRVIQADADTTVALRLAQTDEQGAGITEDVHDMELRDTPGGGRVKLLRQGSEVMGRMRWDGGQMPLLSYPPLRCVPLTPGAKVFVVERDSQLVRGYQAAVGPDGESVTVEARDYTVLPAVASGKQMGRQTWAEFFDAEANDLVAQPREGRPLMPVKLEAYEIQEWKVGEPFWIRMTRWTRSGILIASCELVGKTQLPPDELERVLAPLATAERPLPAGAKPRTEAEERASEAAVRELLRKRLGELAEEARKKDGQAAPQPEPGQPPAPAE